MQRKKAEVEPETIVRGVKAHEDTLDEKRVKLIASMTDKIKAPLSASSLGLLTPELLASLPSHDWQSRGQRVLLVCVLQILDCLLMDTKSESGASRESIIVPNNFKDFD